MRLKIAALQFIDLAGYGNPACPALLDRRYRNLNAAPFALDPRKIGRPHLPPMSKPAARMSALQLGTEGNRKQRKIGPRGLSSARDKVENVPILARLSGPPYRWCRMGQQLRRRTKRKRRKAYLERKRAKQKSMRREPTRAKPKKSASPPAPAE
jgi:hypothetical protein